MARPSALVRAWRSFRAAVGTSRRASASGGTAFAGASGGRLFSDWVLASIQSADQEVRGDIRVLKARSRELVRNNDTAHRYTTLIDEQAIGPSGIRLQARVTRPDGMLDLGINQRIEDAFLEWCQPGNCTVDGRMSFLDVQSNWATTTPTDGEWLVRMIPFRGNRFGFALQILDTDQLDHEFNRARGEGGNEIRMGVEINEWGRPVAYHVWDHHPSEYTARGRERVRLPAEQVIHYFEPHRANATRGIPWFAPALAKLRHIHGYEEATVVAARIAAAKMGFFTQSADTVADPNAPNAEEQNQVTFEIEPGRLDRLPIGWDFKAWDPQQPTTTFVDFHKAMVRGIAGGLGVSYVSLGNDLEGVNFSSIRAGLLNERDAWRRKQKSLIDHFCDRIYAEWLNQALLTGALQLPDRNRQRWMSHRWQPRGYPWVDPEKDMVARLMGVAAGVDSLSRICGELGHDFEDVLVERALENELAKSLGVTIDLGQKKPEQKEQTEEAQALDARVIRGMAESRALATHAPNRVEQLLATTNGNGKGHG